MTTRPALWRPERPLTWVMQLVAALAGAKIRPVKADVGQHQPDQFEFGENPNPLAIICVPINRSTRWCSTSSIIFPNPRATAPRRGRRARCGSSGTPASCRPRAFGAEARAAASASARRRAHLAQPFGVIAVMTHQVANGGAKSATTEQLGHSATKRSRGTARSGPNAPIQKQRRLFATREHTR